MRWAQKSFDDFLVVPPDTGICHQVNLEHLSRVVFTTVGPGGAAARAYPDTLVGTDSHTPMVNGLGVLGWGVGGIEAEAAMLGQPMSMLIPQVVGVRLTGDLREGCTATDLVLTVAELLRRVRVVGKFVDFYGPGVSNVPLATRATIGNMSPEYGSTCAIFPIDAETLSYLRLTGRPERQVRLVEAYAKEQGLWHDPAHEPDYSQTIELDLATVEPSIAGPKRPQDRIPLAAAQHTFRCLLAGEAAARAGARRTRRGVGRVVSRQRPDLDQPESPTRSSTPHPRLRTGPRLAQRPGAGDVRRWQHGERRPRTRGHRRDHVVHQHVQPLGDARRGAAGQKAVQRGLTSRPWVKTTLAPGSRVVTDYLDRAGLTPYLQQLGFDLVGYGCTTCIGNSGPLIRRSAPRPPGTT